MKKVAICVPTYNRAEVVEELLIRCGASFDRWGFDVHIFDSSPNDLTKEVCEKFCGKMNCLRYTKFDSAIHSNLKVYRIFQNQELLKEYDYIWVYSDAIRWSDYALETICTMLDKKYDFIIPDHKDIEKIGTKEYTDNVQLYKDLAWFMTLYGATIVNTKTVLQNIDWAYYEEKYCIPERINFSHLTMYFERITELESFKALHIGLEESDFAPTPLRKASGWHKDTFQVWCEYWPNAMMALPDCYNVHKVEVIKKHGSYSGILVKDNFIQLRKEKIYTFSLFIKCLGKWRKVVDIPLRTLFLISILPEQMLKKENASQINNLKQSVEAFASKYPNIYIYGCGYNGNAVAECLENWKISYKGFCVTKTDNEKSFLRDHEIIEFSGALIEDKKIGFILGLNKKNTQAVLELLEKEFCLERVYDGFSEK